MGTAPADAQSATTATQGSRWLAGPGGRMLNTLNSDLGRLMAAEQAGRHGAARTAGARLAADAAAAQREPMPLADAAVYRSALRQLKTGGQAAASGRLGPEDGPPAGRGRDRPDKSHRGDGPAAAGENARRVMN